MFNDLSKYLDEVEATANTSTEFLRVLNGAIKRLANAIEKSKAAVDQSETGKNKFFAKVHREVKKDVVRLARQFAIFNLRHALGVNEEFNAPAYRRHIYAAVENNDAYLVRTVGVGADAKLRVDMNLDRTGGRLDQWAAGVKAYRKLLEEEKAQKRREAAKKKNRRYRAAKYDPIKASQAWSGIYERREGTHSQFSETIRARLQFSGGLAPFWQLLDKGEVSLKSDRGGYPTPTKTATHFVSDTEKDINEYIDRELISRRKNYYDTLAEYREFLKEAEDRMVRLEAMVTGLRFELAKIREFRTKFEKETGKEIDITKLQKAVQLVKENENAAGKVNVGKGRRAYLSFETIRDIL